MKDIGPFIPFCKPSQETLVSDIFCVEMHFKHVVLNSFDLECTQIHLHNCSFSLYLLCLVQKLIDQEM